MTRGRAVPAGARRRQRRRSDVRSAPHAAAAHGHALYDVNATPRLTLVAETTYILFPSPSYTSSVTTPPHPFTRTSAHETAFGIDLGLSRDPHTRCSNIPFSAFCFPPIHRCCTSSRFIPSCSLPLFHY